MTTFDVSFVIIGLLILQWLILLPPALIMRLGGFPEGVWRITRVEYFGYILYSGDRTPMRHVKRRSELKTNHPNLTYFDVNKSRYYIDENNMERFNGRPQWRYFKDNPFPIPIFKHRDTMIDAEKVNTAFHTDIVKRLYTVRFGEKKGSPLLRRIGIFILVIIGGIIMALIGRSLFIH